MENVNINHDFADEKKSLQIIKSTIAGSRKKLMDDGILLLLWGITFSIGNFWKYYESVVLTAWWMRNLMTVLQYVLGVGVVLFTVYFLFFKKRKVTSFAAISTRYVWIGIILAHNIVVIITKNILNEVNFELLQPLQMVLIGFALFITGGIYRYYVLVISGVIMWFAAALTANYDLNNQFLIRTVAEIICFIIPGILMLNERKNKL